MFGGVGLRTLLGPDSLREPFYSASPSGTVAYVRESVAPAITTFDDKAELRSLRAELRSRPAYQPDNAPPIADAFYAPQPYRSQMGSGLFISGEGLEPEPPLFAGGLGGFTLRLVSAHLSRSPAPDPIL